MEKKRQGCDSDNVVVAQVQISVDFKTIDPKITEEMIITGAFGTSGTNKYVMTLKESGVESFSCIIKVFESVIIKPADRPIPEQTHKRHSVTRRIRSKHLQKSIVQKQSVSQRPFAQFQAPSEVTTKYTLNLKPQRKLHQCTSCTDNATPWMKNNEKRCETTGLVLTKCHQSNYWASNKFCRLSCFKANNGYEGDNCCDNQTPVPCNICTNEETPWMKRNNKQCSSSNLLITKCRLSSTWTKGKFCQQSCFEIGNGYDKTDCCQSTKNTN